VLSTKVTNRVWLLCPALQVQVDLFLSGESHGKERRPAPERLLFARGVMRRVSRDWRRRPVDPSAFWSAPEHKGSSE